MQNPENLTLAELDRKINLLQTKFVQFPSDRLQTKIDGYVALRNEIAPPAPVEEDDVVTADSEKVAELEKAVTPSETNTRKRKPASE